MTEHSITKIRFLLEADAQLQRLLKKLSANMNDADLAEAAFRAITRKKKRLAVHIGKSQHIIDDWHDDGQITTRTMSMNLFGPSLSSTFQTRRHNHSSWADLVSGNTAKTTLKII